MENYFDGPGASSTAGAKPPMKPAAKPMHQEPDADDKGGSIQVHEGPDGASFEFDGESYSSPQELCDALEAKYGGAKESKPSAAPEKAGSYLSKAME